MRLWWLAIVGGLVACGSSVTDAGSGGGPGGGQGASAGSVGQAGGVQGGGGGGGSNQGGQGGVATCAGALGDYGDCDLALGWAFNGEDCVQLSGCGCGPDCDAFSPDFTGCISGCDGYCDSGILKGAGIAADGWGAGNGCDEIYTCVKDDVIPFLQQIVPATTCAISMTCPGGQQRCTLSSGGVVTVEQMDEYCAATLIEDVDELNCNVLGP